MRKTRPSVPTEVTIDVLTGCPCCDYIGVQAEDFLQAFTENLPEQGATAGLRVTFSSFRTRLRKGFDAPPHGAMREFERHGAVARDEKALVGLGLPTRPCGNAH